MTTSSQTINVAQPQGAGLLVRAVYFVLIGLWLSGIWAAIAWLLCVTIIGLPFGLWMLNRLPQVTTLKPQGTALVIAQTGEAYHLDKPQYNFLLRVLYFIFVGWWLSALWITLAWGLCASVIGLIPGFWMVDRVPAITTLARQ